MLYSVLLHYYVASYGWVFSPLRKLQHKICLASYFSWREFYNEHLGAPKPLLP